MAVNRPSGISAVTFFRLLPRALIDFQHPRRIFGAPLGDLDFKFAGEIFAGPALRRGDQVGDLALGDEVAAVDAGAGADVEHIIGGADRVLVVLDDDHGVAEIAQPLERFEQARVVALVQADRRLVEHIEHAGEAGADLRGQPNALALAAGQRARRAGQREIFQPDIDQEFEAFADFFENPDRDFILFGSQPLG